MKKQANSLPINVGWLFLLVVGMLLSAHMAGWGTPQDEGNGNGGRPGDATCPTTPDCNALVRTLVARGGGSPAITGESQTFNGTGVLGRVTGSVGANPFGVVGESPGTGVAGRGSTGVLGESSFGTGVLGRVTGTFGSNLFGVVGRGPNGVLGESTFSGTGVIGRGANTGVLGEAMALSGLSAGVLGRTTSQTGTGVVGMATGTSGTGVGVHGESNSLDGIGVVALNPVGIALQANGATAGAFGGNVNVNGTLTVKGAILSVAELGGERKVGLAGLESPERWVEDFGAATLQNGTDHVNLDPTFTQIANTGLEYHVFLTPRGDCNGLYVAEQTPTGFEVRELNGGASAVRFTYRVVARRRGHEQPRLVNVP